LACVQDVITPIDAVGFVLGHFLRYLFGNSSEMQIPRGGAAQVVGVQSLVLFSLALFLALLVLSRLLFEELAKAGSDASRLPRLSKIADLFAVVMEHITAIEPAIFSPCLMMIGRRFGSVLLRSLIPQFADTGEIILW